MENAGTAVANSVRKEFRKAAKIAVVCGRGNNGGDGFVAARQLMAAGLTVGVFLVEPEDQISTEIARLNFQKIRTVVRPASDLKPSEWDLIVDAMLGIGVKGKIKEPYRSIVRRLNQSRRTMVSVDVPSGWPEQPAVKPTATVTFHAQKDGMNPASCGRIIVANIGIPEEAERFVGPGEFVYYPRPRTDSHKGENGRVLVVGGGPFSGAPALAGMGAMYAGADLAHVAVPAPVAIPVACYSPNIIVHPLSSDVLVAQDGAKLKELAKKCDAMIIGPGLGDDKRTESAVTEVIGSCQLPIVIDADALAPLRKNPKIVKGKRVILTPHKGEFERLSGLKCALDLDRRAEQVSKTAKALGVTILVKGGVDTISDGSRTALNRTGNEAMTVGGTGDVLSGICGCLLSKGMDPFHAACLASFINGAAGDIAFEEKGYGLLATDVASKIPYVLRRFL
jgi:NAD(P)H-hydrate epimerase